MRIILFLSCIIFLFSFTIRLWNLGDAGRWSDEQAIVEKGYRLIEFIKQNDLSNPYWYTLGADHPPLAYYLYGLISYNDFILFDPEAVPSNSVETKGSPVFHYDFPFGRFFSITISSFAIVMVFFIGARYISTFVGVFASVILAMLPHYLGFSQFVALENLIMFFWCGCVLTYLLYIEKHNTWLLLLTGILTGLNIMIKESNILIFIFYFATFLNLKFITKQQISFSHIIYIAVLSLATSLVLWPMVWFHLPEYLNFSYQLWFHNRGLIPELLFGYYMGARSFFYLVAFIVTTPLVILILSIFGIKIAVKKRKYWIYSTIIIWFLTPFFMSFFHHRQHMVRYIIEFYAPLALLAAIGFEYLVTKFTKSNFLKYSLITPVVVYLVIILYSITPYYLNYYNELVGGTNNVYEKRLFFLGWFGEGFKGPGVYIARNARKNMKVGVAANLDSGLYKDPDLLYEKFIPEKQYDYVIVSYFNIIRMGFDESVLKKDYKLVYTEKADNADLVAVYKRK